ncbi:Retrovirus-related Pol polyprotein from transposon TNT 1-94, partial [Linum grandiflorum]
MSSNQRVIADLSKLEALDGSNYKRWSQRMLIVLEQLEVDYVLFSDPPSQKIASSSSAADVINIEDAAKKDTPAKDKSVQETVSKSSKQSDPEKYAKDNKTARGLILNHMVNEVFDLLYQMKSAKDIWDLLDQKYGADDAGTKKWAVGNYLKFTLKDDKPIMEQVHTYENLAAEVLAEGMKICEIFQANVLIEKLPDSWEDYQMKLKHKKKDMSLRELVTHMKIEETSRQKMRASRSKHHSVRAHLVEAEKGNKYKASTQKKPHWRDKSAPYKKPDSHHQHSYPNGCFVCGKTGHRAHQCNYRKIPGSTSRSQAHLVERKEETGKEETGKEESGTEVIAAVIQLESNLVEGKAEWLIDSGACKHFCSSKELFSTLEESNTGEMVYMGNASSSPIMGKGK